MQTIEIKTSNGNLRIVGDFQNIDILKPISGSYINSITNQQICSFSNPELDRLYLLAQQNIFKFEDQTYFDQPNSEHKKIVALSGGKDSIHLLLKIISIYGKEKIEACFVSGINRSESHYERISAIELCKTLGIKLNIFKVSNSIKFNRTGHNIGLREPLIAACIIASKPLNERYEIFFGNIHSYRTQDSKLWGASAIALNIAFGEIAPNVKFFDHIYAIDDATIIFKEMIQKYRDILDGSSSCYSQMNFREHKNKKMIEKFPTIRLYHGCGSCLKCLRLNAAILRFSDLSESTNQDIVGLFNYIKQFYFEKYPEDSDLKNLLTNIFE